MTNKERKGIRQRYTKDTPKFGLFSFKQLLQLFSNTSPEIGANRGESGRKMSVACYQMLPNATRKQGDQRRLKATKIRVAKSDQRCPKKEDTTYQRLILLNSSFMFCVEQKLL